MLVPVVCTDEYLNNIRYSTVFQFREGEKKHMFPWGVDMIENKIEPLLWWNLIRRFQWEIGWPDSRSADYVFFLEPQSFFQKLAPYSPANDEGCALKSPQCWKKTSHKNTTVGFFSLEAANRNLYLSVTYEPSETFWLKVMLLFFSCFCPLKHCEISHQWTQNTHPP